MLVVTLNNNTNGKQKTRRQTCTTQAEKNEKYEHLELLL